MNLHQRNGVTKHPSPQWTFWGEFQALEGLRSLWIDTFEHHPHRGVYLGPSDWFLDPYGNPVGLRDAPIGAYQQVGRVSK